MPLGVRIGIGDLIVPRLLGELDVVRIVNIDSQLVHLDVCPRWDRGFNFVLNWRRAICERDPICLNGWEGWGAIDQYRKVYRIILLLAPRLRLPPEVIRSIKQWRGKRVGCYHIVGKTQPGGVLYLNSFHDSRADFSVSDTLRMPRSFSMPGVGAWIGEP